MTQSERGAVRSLLTLDAGDVHHRADLTRHIGGDADLFERCQELKVVKHETVNVFTIDMARIHELLKGGDGA